MRTVIGSRISFEDDEKPSHYEERPPLEGLQPGQAPALSLTQILGQIFHKTEEPQIAGFPPKRLSGQGNRTAALLQPYADHG